MESGQHVQALEGILPVLFRLGRFEVPSYTFFISLGILTGLLVYYREAKKRGQANEFTFLIAVGAFVGSTLGSKLLELLLNRKREWAQASTIMKRAVGKYRHRAQREQREHRIHRDEKRSGADEQDERIDET